MEAKNRKSEAETVSLVSLFRVTVRRRRFAMAHFVHVDRQKIDRVESALLLSLIGGGLVICVLSATVYDIGRAFLVVFAFAFVR